MTKLEFIKTMNEDTGVIKADRTGHAICTICHGTGEKYEESVQHTEDCGFAQAVAQMTELIPDNFILGVENQISTHIMLTYMAELTNAEIEDLDRMSTELFRTSTSTARHALLFTLGGWAEGLTEDLCKGLVEHGIKDEKERVTLFNYLMFNKGALKKLKRLDAELTEVMDDIQSTTQIFEALLDKKYDLNVKTTA